MMKQVDVLCPCCKLPMTLTNISVSELKMWMASVFCGNPTCAAGWRSKGFFMPTEEAAEKVCLDSVKQVYEDGDKDDTK